MKTRYSLIFLIGLGIFSPLLLSVASDPWHAAAPQRFQLADEAYRQRKNETAARRALEIYRGLFQHDADRESAWRLAMACQFVGMRYTPDSDDKKRLFAEGREAGRAAVKLDPTCAACHFWTAINIALYGQEAGVFKMLFTLKEIEEHLKATITLDPAYAYAGAYRVLGLIENKLPGILGGSDDRAREYFQRAIATVPDEPLNYLFLSRLLQSAFHDPAGAREIAERGLTQPPPEAERVESSEGREELGALVKSLGKAEKVAVTP